MAFERSAGNPCAMRSRRSSEWLAASGHHPDTVRFTVTDIQDAARVDHCAMGPSERAPTGVWLWSVAPPTCAEHSLDDTRPQVHGANRVILGIHHVQLPGCARADDRRHRGVGGPRRRGAQAGQQCLQGITPVHTFLPDTVRRSRPCRTRRVRRLAHVHARDGSRSHRSPVATLRVYSASSVIQPKHGLVAVPGATTQSTGCPRIRVKAIQPSLEPRLPVA